MVAAADDARWEAALASGTFEDASEALEEVVVRLEAGRLPLQRTIDLYDLGVRLAARCDADLAAAELRIRELTVEPGDGAAEASSAPNGLSILAPYDDVPF